MTTKAKAAHRAKMHRLTKSFVKSRLIANGYTLDEAKKALAFLSAPINL